MTSIQWKFLFAVPIACGTVLAVSGTATAVEPTEAFAVTPINGLESISGDEPSLQLAQITSVQQLSDVLPSDWAYQALQNLVDRYNCIQGYPDRTFRGNQALTRFEFAAGLNACLDVLAQLIQTDAITAEEFAAVRRLQEEFQAELSTLRGRVDALEADVAELEANQFSTTTKLRGQVDMHLGIPFSIFDAGGIRENSMSVASRARLNFDSSFTGEDFLRIRMQGGQGGFLQPFGGLANAGGEDFNFTIDDLYYSFPIGSRVDVTIAARGLVTSDWVTSTIVPFDGPAIANASSPNFYGAGGSSSNGAGVGMSFALTDNFVIDAGYTVGYPGASSPDVGIFAGTSQSYIAQLSYLSEGLLDAAFTYIHSDQSEVFDATTTGAVDTFAGLLNLDFGRFFVAGYGAFQDFEGGDDFNWIAGVGYNDLFIEGSQLGIYGGQLPQLAGYASNPWLIEGYYGIPVNEFLTITPAIIYGDADFGSGDEDEIFYGAIRATFSF